MHQQPVCSETTFRTRTKALHTHRLTRSSGKDRRSPANLCFPFSLSLSPQGTSMFSRLSFIRIQLVNGAAARVSFTGFTASLNASHQASEKITAAALRSAIPMKEQTENRRERKRRKRRRSLYLFSPTKRAARGEIIYDPPREKD